MRRILKYVAITLGALLAVLMLVIAIALNTVFTAEKVTPMVRDIAKGAISGDVELQRVDLTFFSTFPRFAVVVDSLSISVDSITPVVVAPRAEIAFAPLRYLIDKQVKINKVLLDAPQINVVTLADSTSTLDVFASEVDTMQVDTVQVDYSDMISSISVEKIQVVKGDINYSDALTGSHAQIKELDFELGGGVSTKQAELNLVLNTPNVNFKMQGRHILRDAPVRVVTSFKVDTDSMSLVIDSARLRLRTMRLGMRGTVHRDTVNKRLLPNLRFGFQVPSVAAIIEQIPPTLIPADQSFESEGKVVMRGSIGGVLSQDSLPTIDAVFKIEGASFKFDSMKYGVDSMSLYSTMHIDLNNGKESTIDVTNFDLYSQAGINLSSSVNVSDPMGECVVSAKLKSDADLDRIMEIFPFVEGVIVRGRNNSDIAIMLSRQMIEQGDYGRMRIDGISRFEDLLVAIDGDLFKMTADSLSQDEQRVVPKPKQPRQRPDSIKGDRVPKSYLYMKMNSGQLLFAHDDSGRLTKAQINFSGIGFKDRGGLSMMLSNVDFSAEASQAKKQGEIAALSANLNLGDVIFALEDSVSLNLARTDATISVKPFAGDRTKPTYRFDLATDSLDFEVLTTLTEGELLRADMVFITTPDSTVHGGHSLESRVSFSGMKAFSKLFPLEVQMKSSTLNFNRNVLTLNNAEMNVGQSNLRLTGTAENMIGYMLGMGNKELPVNFALTAHSQHLNVNQLLAASSGFMVADTTTLESIVDTTSLSLYVPDSRLTAGIDLIADEVVFAESKIDDIDGRIRIRNGGVELSRLQFYVAESPMSLSALYRPKSDSLAYAKFDIVTRGTEISELTKFMPMLDSIMPEMRRMEGVIDFDMVSVFAMNGRDGIVLPSMQGIATISGQELVLMDSENFAEISKMLKFKNRDRNIIDSLHVNVIIEPDGEVLVPPFEVEMDRYRAIIGGRQSIDYENYNVDYEYNISVIKSPLPIKAGVDITGNQDDFKFKITKAKLKKSDFGAIQSNVDSIMVALIVSDPEKLIE